LKGKWLLTINDHPIARELFSRFKIKSLTIHRQAGNTLRPPAQNRLKELLIKSPGC
jgi:hypothetical protein